MTTFKATIARKFTALQFLIGQIVVRSILVALGLLVLGTLVDGMGEVGTAQDTASAPAPAPTPAPAPVDEDGYADHGLFNPDALLDTRQIDDLRQDPETKCYGIGGVWTPAGQCVDAATIWEDEVSAETWADLYRAGFPIDIDNSGYGEDEALALLVPAEWLVLGGENGEDLLAVDQARPLTPRLVTG